MISKLFTSICILALINGCIDITHSGGDVAYLGGEIVNPKTNVVTLLNTRGQLIDSIVLNNDNRFIYKIKNLESGLYSISHGDEYQMVLLEPNDSIMFRLNTYDFDESLVFTGKGANKNNYLIKTYLNNEKEASKLVKYAKMKPEAFNSFIENRRQKQLQRFHEFLGKNDVSDFFKSIIESSINYNNYADKEIYPFAYFGENKLQEIKNLPEQFYTYRKDIDYNANHLSHFFSYNRFLFFHIDNLALDAFYKNETLQGKFNRQSLQYNIKKLELVDSIFENETLKNNLLKYKAKNYISYNHTEDEIDTLLRHFLSKSSNDEDKSSMKELVSALKLLRQGNKIPELKLISYDNKEFELKSIIKNPSIIYFWSSHSKAQYRNSHYLVKQLKQKFPKTDFISININDNDDKYWKEIIDNYKFSNHHEFRFKNSKKALKKLAINYLNKSIIVNSKGEILHPNANIFSSDFHSTLEELLRKKQLVY